MPLFALLMGVVLTFSGRCPCTKALDGDVPHGANQNIEMRGLVVKKLVGTISYPNETVAKDVVVELYDLPPDKSDIPTDEIISSHIRRSACLTGTDGAFCFSDLPSGRYLLRAGTRQLGGVNELYVRLKVDRSWFRGVFRRSKPLHLTLELGN